jgi:hypothetical protein
LRELNSDDSGAGTNPDLARQLDGDLVTALRDDTSSVRVAAGGIRMVSVKDLQDPNSSISPAIWRASADRDQSAACWSIGRMVRLCRTNRSDLMRKLIAVLAVSALLAPMTSAFAQYPPPPPGYYPPPPPPGMYPPPPPPGMYPPPPPGMMPPPGGGMMGQPGMGMGQKKMSKKQMAAMKRKMMMMQKKKRGGPPPGMQQPR